MSNAPTKFRTAFLTVVAMIAFAGNSLLCRAALKQTEIDAARYDGSECWSLALA